MIISTNYYINIANKSLLNYNIQLAEHDTKTYHHC